MIEFWPLLGLGLGWRVGGDLVIDRGRAGGWRPSTSTTQRTCGTQDTAPSSPPRQLMAIALQYSEPVAM